MDNDKVSILTVPEDDMKSINACNSKGAISKTFFYILF